MEKRPSFFICLLLDGIGMLSWVLPVVGEATDLIWAPLAAFIYIHLFGFRKRAPGGALLLIEELLPGTDFLPTFTLTWLWLKAKDSYRMTA
ncbi:MAG: hypothetical protein ABR95_08595 [Sphingobacteriales bacterium BACL12 MAG-120813-bin55]|jgi:hypothetical protein|nr:MAG: hypothetical protein ABR94_03980 [Sphingobacteriales bacterium BACL12 MAG-120802-bin5]KRP13978.1 MAG: hypothetical protein ABR95_08595 [Sphingobacteriales bacterium BACL12 MAG-120813-bin55]